MLACQKLTTISCPKVRIAGPIRIRVLIIVRNLERHERTANTEQPSSRYHGYARADGQTF